MRRATGASARGAGQRALRQSLTKKSLHHGKDDGAQEPASPGPDPEMAMSVLARFSLNAQGSNGEGAFLTVGKEAVDSVLRRRRNIRRGCTSLPFTVAFFVIYTLSVAFHEDVRTVYLAESQVRDLFEGYTFDVDNSRNLDGIVEVKDVWLWLFQVLLPAAFQQTDHLNNTLPQEEWSTVLQRNRMKGGLILQQFRRPGAEPPGRKWARAGHNSTQAGPVLYFEGEGSVPLPDTPSAQVFEEYQRNLRAAVGGGGPSAVGAHANPKDESGDAQNTYTFFLFEQERVEVNRERLKYLEESRWIDLDTTQVAVKMLFVNEDVGLVLHAAIRFVFPPTGGIFSAMTMQTSFLEAYRDPVSGFIDFLWISLLLSISATEFKEVFEHFRERRVSLYFQDFWNCLDWATIVVGFVLIALFIQERSGISPLSEYLSFVNIYQRPNTDYWGQMYRLHEQIGVVTDVNMWFRLLLGDYMLLIMMRFFKAFKAQPRLALVTNTIYSAGSDLLHFGIVFMSVFLSFAFSASVFFGRRLADFSSFTKSFGACFAMAFGDFDWSVISSEHTATATFWFWSFMVLVFLVMLNMVLAIVMDVYTEVRGNALDADPLWTQAKDLLESQAPKLQKLRHRVQGVTREDEVHEVADDVILSAMQHLGKEVTNKSLRRVVPELSEDQADRVLTDAEAWEKQVVNKGLGLTDALKLIHKMSLKVDELSAHLGPKKAAAKKTCTVSKAKRKFKRMIFTAMHNGELERLAAKLRDDDQQEEVKQDWMSYKIRKAEGLLKQEDEVCQEGSEQIEPDSPKSFKGPRSKALREPESPKGLLSSFGVDESSAERSDWIMSEIKLLHSEIRRSERDRVVSLEPLLLEVTRCLLDLQTLVPALQNSRKGGSTTYTPDTRSAPPTPAGCSGMPGIPGTPAGSVCMTPAPARSFERVDASFVRMPPRAPQYRLRSPATGSLRRAAPAHTAHFISMPPGSPNSTLTGEQMVTFLAQLGQSGPMEAPNSPRCQSPFGSNDQARHDHQKFATSPGVVLPVSSESYICSVPGVVGEPLSPLGPQHPWPSAIPVQGLPGELPHPGAPQLAGGAAPVEMPPAGHPRLREIVSQCGSDTSPAF